MKKVFVSLALAALGFAAQAQLINVGSIERVALPEGTQVYTAVISPDGSSVAAAQLKGDGLDIISLADGSVKHVADLASPHYLSYSADGRSIAFREPSYKKGLRHVALKAYNTTTGKTQTLVKASRNLQGVAVVGNTALAVDGGKLKAKSLDGAKAQAAPVASIERGQLYITVDGETKMISPNGISGNSYLWPEISPDQTKVCYYLAGSGAWVCNLDGSNAQRIGWLRAAKWYDNNTVVGMLDHDNGEFVTDSSIIARSIDGTVEQVLTGSDVRAMFPSVSADGSKIAFNTPDGALYIINVNR